jgi:hypothetical protein
VSLAAMMQDTGNESESCVFSLIACSSLKIMHQYECNDCIQQKRYHGLKSMTLFEQPRNQGQFMLIVSQDTRNLKSNGIIWLFVVSGDCIYQ